MIPVYNGNQINEYFQQMSDETTNEDLVESVSSIIQDIQKNGDAAVRKYALEFDGFEGPKYLLSQDDVRELVALIPKQLKASLKYAAENIRRFNEAIVDSINDIEMQMDGYQIGMRFLPVESVACYVPGGRFPLPSTALMTAITAQVAGVKDIALFSPALTPSVVYAGVLAGVERFYRIGGVQAVAACAFGTESIPRVDMIVGPGNAYVAEAKRQLQGKIGIDLLAGPSEVAILADDSANPDYVAADLLAQAEHDPLAKSWLITDDKCLADKIITRLAEMYELLKLPGYVINSLKNSAIFFCESLEQCVDVTNLLAPEHLQLMVSDPEGLKETIVHYGSLFIGENTTVAYGDYAAGVNHTLPTGRSARFSSGLSPLTFMRTQTWTEVTGDPLDLKRHSKKLAEEEGLRAHRHSVSVRS